MLTLHHGQRSTWPQDRFGRPLPVRPVRGLRVEVLDGHLWVRFSVRNASRQRFVAVEGLTLVERPSAQWGDWLEELVAQAPVIVHAPGCDMARCHGCDGSTLGQRAEPRLTLVG
jgi:hypothetical protein